MNMLGTGIAAAVAQANLQARKVAGRRDRRARDRDLADQRMRDMYETHLKVLEEHDETQHAQRPVVDYRLQDDHSAERPDPRAADDSQPHIDTRA